MTSDSITPRANWKTPYQNQFRKQVHMLLYRGYLNALQDICRRHHNEPDVTGFVVREMKKLLKERYFEWSNLYSVHENNPVEGEGRTGSGRKIPDISVEAVTRKRRPEYLCEAKRLSDDAQKKEAGYVGSEGLGCFVMEHYASEYPEAIMLGYVQTGHISEWSTRIWHAIETKFADELKLKRAVEQVLIIEEISHEFVSEHSRDTAGLISVYHILLDCCPLNCT